jgi:hypothetical protein
MPLDFAKRRPRPFMPRASLLRLGSLLMGLVLVGGMMNSLRTPQTQARLAALFGGPPASQTPEQLEVRQRAATQLATKVDRKLLETFDDDTPFRDAESPAWFHLLVLARDTPAAEMSAASAGEVTYAQLLQQPRHYRGRVVTVTGLAHRIEPLAPGDNDHAIEVVHRVIVQPSGRGRLPFTCYCLELPEGYAVGETPRPVRLEGFFVKNLVYGHEEGLDKTPVIVAPTLTPLDGDSAATPVNETPGVSWMVATMVVMAVVVALFLWQAMKPPKPLPRIADAGPGDDPATVAAALRELATARDAHESEPAP